MGLKHAIAGHGFDPDPPPPWPVGDFPIPANGTLQGGGWTNNKPPTGTCSVTSGGNVLATGVLAAIEGTNNSKFSVTLGHFVVSGQLTIIYPGDDNYNPDRFNYDYTVTS